MIPPGGEGWLAADALASIPLAWRPSPHADDRPGGERPSLLVVHGISLPPGQFGGGWVEALFEGRLVDPPEALIQQEPWVRDLLGLRVSAHFFIDRQGAVTQFVSILERAWHAGQSSFAGRGRCNDFSIGVELEGTDHQPYTEAQMTSLVQLSRVLSDQTPGLNTAVGHEDIAPGRKTDPGPCFDWPDYQRRLALEGLSWALRDPLPGDLG